MKEVKIQIPDNCELIKNGDTYIVKEKGTKPRTWEEFCTNFHITSNEYYIEPNGRIIQNPISDAIRVSPTWCVSKEEAEAFLALMQLRQLRKAWIDDWDYKVSSMTYIPCIIYVKDAGLSVNVGYISHPLSFPTVEMAEEFLDCFRDLCETAKMLL